jgi:hypothetical protein
VLQLAQEAVVLRVLPQGQLQDLQRVGLLERVLQAPQPLALLQPAH